MKVQGIVALAAVALAVAACGGGGGGGGGSTGLSSAVLPTNAPTTAGVAPATNAPLPAGFAVASVTITVPKASIGSSGSSRRAQTIGAGTNSITFSLLQLNGATASSTPQSYGLTATSPGCATQPATGNLVCSLNINAPIGSDIFLAQTYTGTNGNGSLTGSGAMALTVALNSTNTASLSLSGQVASVFLAASYPFPYLGPFSQFSKSRRAAPAAVPSAAPTPGVVNSLQLFVIALDSSNNVILNPSVYTSPVYLQLFYASVGAPDVSLQVVPGSEGGATTSTSANYGTVTVNSPSDVITASILPNVANGSQFIYVLGNVGSPLLQPLATLPPLPPNAVLGITVTTLVTPSNQIVLFSSNSQANVTRLDYSGIMSDIVEVTETGYSGTFTDNAAPCAGIAALNLLANNGGFAEIQVNGVAVGSCTATISDGIGNTINVPITVTTTSVTGS